MIPSFLIVFLLLASGQQPQPSGSAKDYFDKAVVSLLKGDVNDAINDLDKAIELNPQYVEAFYVRAQSLFLKRDFDRALLDYNKVIELAPQMLGIESVYNTRSVIRISKGDYDGALKDSEHAIAINPNHADFYANRGLVRDFRNDKTGALSDYEKALALNPKLPATYINRGILRYESENFTGAMSDLNRALEIAPSVAKPYVDRGVMHILTGEIDLAVTDIKKALSLDPASLSEKDSGMTPASSPIKRLQTFITSHPTNARGYEARGLLRLAQGRKAEAAKDFAKTLELNPKLQSEIDKLMNITF